MILNGCTRGANAPSGSAPVTNLVTRGRAVYQANCIACHNSDPKKPGAVGPDVFGSSRALLEARVLSAKYPEGYRPKRTTAMMVALPALRNDLDALFAYLNAD